MNFNFKQTGMTVVEATVLGGAMLADKKFLDFNVLFKNKIAADPTFASKWFIVHQGALKAVPAAWAATQVKNPWIKMALIGVVIAGVIQEIRVLTTKAGVAFFDKIGDKPTDQELDAAAKNFNRLRSVKGFNSGTLSGFQNNLDFPSNVAGFQNNLDFPSNVAGFSGWMPDNRPAIDNFPQDVYVSGAAGY